MLAECIIKNIENDRSTAQVALLGQLCQSECHGRGHECNGHTADPPRSCKIFITDRFRGTQGNDQESRMEILC